MNILAKVLVFLSIFPTLAAANSSVLTVVLGDEHTPPYEVIHPEQPPGGFHIELIRTVAAQLDLAVEFVALPWPRALHSMQTGSADAISFASKTRQRQHYIDYREDNLLSQTQSYFMQRKDQPSRYDGNLPSVAPYRIGVQQDYAYGAPFDTADYLNKQSVQTVSQLISMLNMRRLDLAIISRVSYLAQLQSGQADNIQLLQPAVARVNNYIGFSKRSANAKLVEPFTAAMRAFKQSLAFARLKEKYHISDLIAADTQVAHHGQARR